MTRSRLFVFGAVLLGVAWLGGRAAGVVGDGESDSEPPSDTEPRAPLSISATHPRIELRASPRPRSDGTVTISGTVLDRNSAAPIGDVEVVFRDATGEQSAIASADGRYRIELPSGTYRAFVRDETVFSVGMADRVRLPGLPSLDTAGVPDETLMPVIAATRDTAGVDLVVLRGGVVAGKVTDGSGRPVSHAVIRAVPDTGYRPSLGTDVTETDAAGAFELRIPAGAYQLEATHARYAGLVDGLRSLEVGAGDHVTADLTLTAGCVIAGRVVDAHGAAASEGAIELQWGSDDHEFSPSGRIAPDGTFRWVTTEPRDVTLRAWPWQSPRSPSRTFRCRDGARFEGVVFALPDRGPDISGVLADAAAAPVAFAFIDLAPLDPDGISQQERTDADGRWSVFHMPAGRYQVTAYVPGRGVVGTTIRAPQANVALALGGVGRIEGTTTLDNGSFELALAECTEPGSIVIADHRLVAVAHGRFEIDNVPACNLAVVASVLGRQRTAMVSVAPDGIGRLELDLAPPHPKHVTGIVRDDAGRPVENASVLATYGDEDAAIETAEVTTDASGRFELHTYAGAGLTVTYDARSGSAEVGTTNAASEQIDIVLRDVPPDPDPPIADDTEPEPEPEPEESEPADVN